MHRSAAEHLAALIDQSEPAVVTCVPGYGASEVFARYIEGQKEGAPFSYHEEVAYTVAHGASLTGAHAVTLLKAHGLAKAANSVVDSLSAGTTGGFVPIIFNDPTGRHSDSILEAAELAAGLDLPHETAGTAALTETVRRCFERSIEKQLPCALIVEADELAAGVDATRTIRISTPPRYERSPRLHLLSPLFGEFQHQVLEAKKTDRPWKDLPRPEMPRIPSDLPEEWQDTIRDYAPFFEVFTDIERGVAAGDTSLSSLFALPPYECVDITTYMGGSVPLALGAHLSGHKNCWALSGDFSFLAAGHLGLLEARQRQIPLNIVVFVNGTAAATGHQPVPTEQLQQALCGYKSSTHLSPNPKDKASLRAALDEMTASDRLQILLLDYTGELTV